MALINRDEQPEHLFKRIESYLDYTLSKHKLHNFMNSTIIVVGLLVSASIGYFGLTDKAEVAGILGLVISFLIGIQNSFKFGDKAVHYLTLHADAKDVRDLLYYEPDGDPHVINVSEQFKRLKSEGLKKLPKDSNLDQILGNKE